MGFIWISNKSLNTKLKMGLITNRRLIKLIPKIIFDKFYYNNLNYGVYKMSTSSIEIPRSKEEYDDLLKLPVPLIPNSKILTVSILGTPNAGKSTLINHLLDRRVCSVSKKVHTTKKNSLAFLTKDKTQIAFLDTPGLISIADKRKHKLDMNMYTAPGTSLKKADLIVCLVDASNKWTRHRLDPNILRLLDENRDKNSILVLNKVDEIKHKHILLDLSRLLTNEESDPKVGAKSSPTSLETILRRTKNTLQNYSSKEKYEVNKNDSEFEINDDETSERKSWAHFKEVFMISALNGDGVEDLKNYFFECAKPGQWIVNPNLVTDQTPKEIAMAAVREKLLDKLPHQIPYVLKYTIELWEEEDHVLKISMKIISPEKRYLKYIIGPAGKTIGDTADEARQELTNIFRCEVSLKLIAFADI